MQHLILPTLELRLHYSGHKKARSRACGATCGGRMKKFLLILLVLMVPLAEAANTSKLSPDLLAATQGKNSGAVRVIVQYNNAPGLLDLNLLGTLGSLLNALPLVNALVA